MKRFMRPRAYRPVHTIKTDSSGTVNEDGLAPPSMTSWPGSWSRIGRRAGSTILLGTILQLATFGFLVFLWAGRGSDDSGAQASALWRRIFLSGAGTRVVTVCALVIRSTVGLQATVCTGLAAALVLEARDVADMSNAATFSILRAVNGGPMSFLSPLARTPRKLASSMPAVLILVLWLGSMAISFSSTVLLSDFHTVSLVRDPYSSFVPIADTSAGYLGPFMDSPSTTSSPGMWLQPLQAFPSFGEATLEAPVVRDALSDTGLIKRSFIPLQAESRKNLRSYQGASVVYTSRVGCTRPTITGQVTGLPGSAGIAWDMARVYGNLTWEPLDINLPKYLSCGPAGSTCPPVPFSCALPYEYRLDPMSDPPTSRRPPTSLCIFHMYYGSVPVNETSPVFMLVIDMGMNTERWQNMIMTPYEDALRNRTWEETRRTTTLPKQKNWREWAVFDFGDGLTLNATMCLATAGLQLERVSLSTTIDVREPEIQRQALVGTWSVNAILNMVTGTGNLSYASRGILALDEGIPVTPDEVDKIYLDAFGSEPDREIMYDLFRGIQSGINNQDMTAKFPDGDTERWVETNFSFYMCTDCSSLAGFSWQTHPYLSLLFHAAVNKTASVAQALHATFFWLYQGRYYNALPGFDLGNYSTMVKSTAASIPVGRAGLVIVGALMLLNLTCVFAVTGLFLWRTQWSLYGNVWHAVAQLVAGPEMASILEGATAMTDREVEDRLQSEGIRSVNIGLWDQGDGKLVVASGSDHSASVGV